MRTKVLIPRILMLLYISAVAFLCFHRFSSMPSVPTTLLGIPMDKIAHFCMFLPFPVIAAMCFDKVPAKQWQIIAASIAVLAAGCVFAALTEIIQSRLSYRTGDKIDFLADALAMTIGSVATVVILTRKRNTNA